MSDGNCDGKYDGKNSDSVFGQSSDIHEKKHGDDVQGSVVKMKDFLLLQLLFN